MQNPRRVALLDYIVAARVWSVLHPSTCLLDVKPYVRGQDGSN